MSMDQLLPAILEYFSGYLPCGMPHAVGLAPRGLETTQLLDDRRQGPPAISRGLLRLGQQPVVEADRRTHGI